MQEQIALIKNWLGSGSINLFGLPFAGKDTQGKKLADLLGGELISGGDILRHTTNQQVLDIMAAGGIIPSELFEEIVIPYFARPEICDKPLILSEVGRMLGEEQVILRATQQTNHTTKAVILLSLHDDEVWQRFDASQVSHDRGNRADDNKNVLQNRLDKFHSKVEPVLNIYRDMGLLITIDGSLQPQQVTENILAALAKKAA